MLTLKNTFGLILLTFLFTSGQVFAQSGEAKKELVIEKVTIDENGKEVKETIRLSGKEAEEYMKKHGGQHGENVTIEMEGEGKGKDVFIIKTDEEGADLRIEGLGEDLQDGINVTVMDENGKTRLKIKKEGMEPFVWEGEGEVPEAVKKELKEKYGVDLNQSRGDEANVFIIKTDEDGALEELEGLHEEHAGEVMVNINETNGTTTLEIKKEGTEPFKWEGEGPIPAEVKAAVKEKYGVDLDGNHREGQIEKRIHIEKDGNTNKARLGVMVEGEDSQNGAKVLDVVPGSPAAKAGLQKDDLITEINGQPTRDHESVVKEIGKYSVADQISISFVRDGQQRSADAVLEANDGTQMRVMRMDGEQKVIGKKKIIVIKKEIDQEDGADHIKVTPPAVENTLALPDFKAFPNPTEGMISVNFTGKAAPATIRITDITGKEVYKEELSNFDGRYNQRIDLKDAAKGTLLLNIQQGSKIFTHKIVYQ